ncbi:MAG: hypothetical protein HeimC2_13460 [Candidatus Heimdallarchaeota archaeon LC_2]|nr:MAG: hypothetical protein HeimC2_13460 [Candidatus Heimdallarchaeota archaeon LC_2]
MELLKLSSKKIKFTILGILFILITGNNSPVYAVSYHFAEDFSIAPDTDWKFSAWFYPPSLDYEKTNHTFTFDDELISAGEPNGKVSNYATKNDTTAFGAWSFDIFIPTNPLTNVWGASFSIEWDYLKLTSYFGEPDGADWPEFILDGYGEGLRMQAWNKTKDPFSDRLKFAQSDSGLKFDTYQHFEVIRTPADFYVYNGGNLIFETEFSSNLGPEINYFTVIAAQGSGVKYDNIKITSDYQGVLDSLLSESDNSESGSNALFYTLGVGIVALIGGRSYSRFKLKEI